MGSSVNVIVESISGPAKYLASGILSYGKGHNFVTSLVLTIVSALNNFYLIQPYIFSMLIGVGVNH